MKPSIETEHVSGEKKPRDLVAVAKRIGLAIFEGGFIHSSNISRDNNERERLRKEARARALILDAMNKLKENDAFKKAQQEAEDGAVKVQTETPTAIIEATSTAHDYSPGSSSPLESWSLRVTTRAEKPLITLFSADIVSVYPEIRYPKENETKIEGVRSINPETGKEIFYYSEKENLALYESVLWCFNEMSQRAQLGLATIEAIPRTAQEAA